MEDLKWNIDYSVGVAELDRQHTELIDLINKCNNTIKSGETKVNKQILDQVILFINDHFSLEEQYMIQAGFNGFKEHKKEHDIFVEIATSYREQHKAGTQIVIENIIEFLVDWLTEHILIKDKQYTKALNDAGIK